MIISPVSNSRSGRKCTSLKTAATLCGRAGSPARENQEARRRLGALKGIRCGSWLPSTPVFHEELAYGRGVLMGLLHPGADDLG